MLGSQSLGRRSPTAAPPPLVNADVAVSDELRGFNASAFSALIAAKTNVKSWVTDKRLCSQWRFIIADTHRDPHFLTHPVAVSLPLSLFQQSSEQGGTTVRFFSDGVGGCLFLRTRCINVMFD